MGLTNSFPILESTITELELSDRGLESIPFHIRSNNNVSTIDLSNNFINYLPKNLNKVHCINLSNNHFDDIYDKVLVRIINYPRLSILDLSNNSISKLPEKFNKFKCLTQLKISNNVLVNLENLPEMMEAVDASQNKITRIPNLPNNIRFLIIDYNLIETIENEIQNLSILLINMNKLVRIKGDLVFHNLEILEVSKNKLKKLPDFTLFAHKLKKLDASNNYLYKFPKLPKSIVELYLDKNKIKKIPKTLSAFNNLKIFKISHNNLKKCPKLPPSIKLVEMFSNKIKQIEDSETPRLKTCLIYDNKLNNIPKLNETQITEINFIRNRIKNFYVEDLLKRITKLNLSENSIKEIPSDLFLLPNLIYLNISKNKIRFLPDSFMNSKLKCLNISENPIHVLTDNFPLSISVLYCSFCKLKKLPDTFSSFDIETIVACGNKIRKLPQMKNIKKLMLSRNNFRKFPKNLPESLIYLDFSCNEIEKIPDDLNLHNILEINLSYNKIKKFPHFENFRNIKTLKISNNPIKGEIDLDNFLFLDCIDISSTKISLKSLENSIREIFTSDYLLHTTDKYKCKYIDSKIKYVSFAELCGHREFMEDSIVISTNVRDNLDLFCVFDGHGGSFTSSFCSYEITQIIKSSSFKFDESSIYSLCEELNESVRKQKFTDGSTLAMTLISDNEIIIAHLGDSRIVLIEEDGSIRHSTIDHKPDSRPEFERILNEKGKVQKGRINGILAISRSLGDFSIPGIGTTPDVIRLKILPKDKWIILGCDGLFDVITDKDISRISLRARNPRDLAYDLRNIAYHRLSPDNISVIVVNIKDRSSFT